MANNSVLLFNNDLNLQLKHAARVKICFDIINDFLPDSEIYLFGSYAKREIKDESDIDILVLLGKEITSQELQKIRWKIEDEVEAINHNAFELDLKIYSKKFYEDQLSYSYFFIEIEKYKKDLRGVKWT
ncbi:MAG: hypothetical protein K0R69_2987 [Clostridia bacterium]|jgi:predicted nucleotidyltransferase|nr:hypothetical protein [Clostridia bacterium]